MSRDVGCNLRLTSCCTPPEPGTKVGELELDPVDGVTPSRPVPMIPASRGLESEVRRVAISRRFERSGLGQAILRELADRLEQAVARPRRRVVGDDERLADERIEVFEDIHLVVAVDDSEDAREVEAAREDRRGAEESLLVVGQQVV